MNLFLTGNTEGPSTDGPSTHSIRISQPCAGGRPDYFFFGMYRSVIVPS